MPRLDWMTEKQAMLHLQVGRTVIRDLRKHGLPHYRVGRSVRYERSELDEWVLGRKVQPLRLAGGRRRTA